MRGLVSERASEPGRLAVIGAIDVDLVVSGAALPRPGRPSPTGNSPGTTGARAGTRATAAARVLGEAGRVAMLGAVGDDDMGRAARAALEAEGIDVANVAVVAGSPTGVALIAVDQGGQNQISVAPGANRDLGDPTEALEVRARRSSSRAARSRSTTLKRGRSVVRDEPRGVSS